MKIAKQLLENSRKERIITTLMIDQQIRIDVMTFA